MKRNWGRKRLSVWEYSCERPSSGYTLETRMRYPCKRESKKRDERNGDTSSLQGT